MDLSTTYLGLRLDHPLMPGASPLSDDLDAVRRLEDAGAAAIVMHSLFEEQVARDPSPSRYVLGSESGPEPEVLSYFPDPTEYALRPDDYLGQIAAIKRAVAVPVIASLNGTTPGGWLDYARQIEQAGADALELNVYSVASEPGETGLSIEDWTLELLRAVKSRLRIPVALKLSPYYTSLANFAGRLDQAGADGLILFNRFYQPDVDLEDREVVQTLRLSDPGELHLRLRWLAILSTKIRCSLAASGGVYCGTDALKAILCGAHAVQMVSALLRHGPEHLGRVKAEMTHWMEKHGAPSLREVRGSLALPRRPDATAFERANYVHVLQQWRDVTESQGSGRRKRPSKSAARRRR